MERAPINSNESSNATAFVILTAALLWLGVRRIHSLREPKIPENVTRMFQESHERHEREFGPDQKMVEGFEENPESVGDGVRISTSIGEIIILPKGPQKDKKEE